MSVSAPDVRHAIEENRRLRRTMRDLVALSTLPAVWSGLDRDDIARSLSGVLLDTLSLDVVYLRLAGRTGKGAVDIVRCGRRHDTDYETTAKAALAALLNAPRGELPKTIPDPCGAGTLQLAVVRFGVGADPGALVAGSRKPDFPTEQDRLLLGVGANQMAIVVQRRQAEEELQRHRNARLALTQELNQAVTVEEAATGVLRAVCEHLAWDAGFFWIIDDDGDRLACRAHWHRPDRPPKQFVAASCEASFRSGEGLPGRVWASGTPAWIADLSQDGNFMRLAAAAEDGLRCAFACPVILGDRTIGVIEFFTHQVRELDADLLEMVGTAGGNVGQFIERKAAEDELRRSEQELAEFFENATIGLHWVDSDGKILKANHAELQMLGYTRAEYLGRHIAEFHADPDVIGAILDKLNAGERLIEYPARLRCKDGSIKHVLIDSSVLWNDGRFVHTRCFTRDITERTRVERALADARSRLEAALEAGAIATWNWDIPGNLLFGDGTFDQLFNLPPSEGQGGVLDKYLGAIHPDDVPRVTAALERAVHSGEPYEADYRIVQPDGSARWVTARGRTERDAAGRPIRMPGVLVDITARKRLEEALLDADRRKDEFLAILAHELRNPLAPIRNSLEILKLPRIDASAVEESRAMIERQVHHLVRLVDDLLDVSRVMRGKIELRKEPLEIAAVVARAVETVQPLIDMQRHRLELSIPDESLLVDADPVRLAQVVGNLLTNSAKYTESHGHIWVSAVREQGVVALSVRDDGIGMAAEMLPRVFELFVQVDHASTRAQGGLGIGLTLSQNLVRLHGGTIEARSAGLGQGSEFIVRLPLMAPAHGEPVEGLSDERALEAAASGHRLLVVDDNSDAATSLAMLLRMHGHEVRIAQDGPSALAMATAFVPDMVFLDLGMPGMDGYEVARRLRSQPALEQVVLTALTGWGQQEDRRRTAEAGFDHHLVKPLELKALETLLKAL
ncbi:PAS domain S-box protein [Aquincola sp. S2]|uniref:histidine kinase n=1 Tax=Pseudaquabacterium terrae TaxID=2732868 RepID=A0ABX2EFE2_9BURK|nr:ATP-binding protein [Aquabacterium terrae]NRF67316.1 PAS domain S-box protein [Aquabacterium terrae]